MQNAGNNVWRSLAAGIALAGVVPGVQADNKTVELTPYVAQRASDIVASQRPFLALADVNGDTRVDRDDQLSFLSGSQLFRLLQDIYTEKTSSGKTEEFVRNISTLCRIGGTDVQMNTIEDLSQALNAKNPELLTACRSGADILTASNIAFPEFLRNGLNSAVAKKQADSQEEYNHPTLGKILLRIDEGKRSLLTEVNEKLKDKTLSSEEKALFAQIRDLHRTGDMDTILNSIFGLILSTGGRTQMSFLPGGFHKIGEGKYEWLLTLQAGQNGAGGAYSIVFGMGESSQMEVSAGYAGGANARVAHVNRTEGGYIVKKYGGFGIFGPQLGASVVHDRVSSLQAEVQNLSELLEQLLGQDQKTVDSLVVSMNSVLDGQNADSKYAKYIPALRSIMSSIQMSLNAQGYDTANLSEQRNMRTAWFRQVLENLKSRLVQDNTGWTFVGLQGGWATGGISFGNITADKVSDNRKTTGEYLRADTAQNGVLVEMTPEQFIAKIEEIFPRPNYRVRTLADGSLQVTSVELEQNFSLSTPPNIQRYLAEQGIRVEGVTRKGDNFILKGIAKMFVQTTYAPTGYTKNITINPSDTPSYGEFMSQHQYLGARFRDKLFTIGF